MVFIKGFQTDETFILEGSRINVTTVQGEVFNNVILSHCAKKALGFMIDGEIGERLFSLDTISNVEQTEV